MKVDSPGHSISMFSRALLLVLVCLCTQAAPALAGSRPNILLIFTDDQGMNDVGTYGSEIKTPHIDSLARDGMKFTQWYVASSICTPSRYGLLTGKYPTRSRDGLLSALMFLNDKERGIQKGETIFPALLRKGGYHTALIGKWHLGHGNKGFLPTRHGFNEFIGHTGGCIDFYTMRYGIEPDWYHGEKHVDESGYATDLITDEAVDFLKRQRKSRPFFLHLAYNAPHFGKGYDPGKAQTVNIMQPPPRDMLRVKHIKDPVRRQFAAMVVNLDDGIGRVLKALKANGQEKNTLVIFMTDHGGDYEFGGSNKPFRGEKATLFEGGIRVPCLMRWPGKIKASSSSNAVLSALDLFPTFCGLAGVDVGGRQLDGQDISGILGGVQKTLPSRELFWHTGSHAELKRGQWTALRQGDWKFLETAKGKRHLFNLEQDPHEKADLKAQHPKLFNDLKNRRDALLKECLPK